MKCLILCRLSCHILFNSTRIDTVISLSVRLHLFPYCYGDAILKITLESCNVCCFCFIFQLHKFRDMHRSKPNRFLYVIFVSNKLNSVTFFNLANHFKLLLFARITHLCQIVIFALQSVQFGITGLTLPLHIENHGVRYFLDGF